MKLASSILTLVAAIYVTPVVSHGIPSDHITQVNSEAEYDAILDEEHRRLSEANANLRTRVLQETGTEDSLPILADYYGGEPGFYHSVGTLCYLVWFGGKKHMQLCNDVEYLALLIVVSHGRMNHLLLLVSLRTL
jgi:hypothetical protein